MKRPKSAGAMGRKKVGFSKSVTKIAAPSAEGDHHGDCDTKKEKRVLQQQLMEFRVAKA